MARQAGLLRGSGVVQSNVAPQGAAVAKAIDGAERRMKAAISDLERARTALTRPKP